ncbi:MAG: hypothetical protein V3V12_05125 [Gammaproteobacteria bacterium]
MGQTLSIQKIIPSVIAGAIVAALQITFVLAFAALLLSQSLSPYLVQGIGVLLTGTVISIVIIALLSSYPGSFGSAQDIPATLMSIMVISITSTYAQQDRVLKHWCLISKRLRMWTIQRSWD